MIGGGNGSSGLPRAAALLLLPLLLALACAGEREAPAPVAPAPDGDTARVILVVVDGVRWEDFFDVPSRRLREDDEPAPFAGFWRELAGQGAVWGDRTEGSRVRMTLRHAFARRLSIPSYQAIFAGWAQPCTDNACGRIGVETFPEALRRRLGLRREQVAIVATCPCATVSAARDPAALWMDDGTQVPPPPGERWRQRPDAATMAVALDVLRRERPRFLMIQLDDPDWRAHERDREGYLRACAEADAFLLRLVATLDEMGPGERARTTLLVTTDHGRGEHFGFWKTHGEMWWAQDVFLAAIGPHVEPTGRVPGGHAAIFHADLRPTVELLFGLEPSPCDHPTCGRPIAAIVAGAPAGTARD